MLGAIGLTVQISIAALLVVIAAATILRVIHSRDDFPAMLMQAGGRGLRMDRVQSFALSMGFIIYYAIDALATGVPSGRLPEVDPTIVTVLAGSQAFYIAGKMRPVS